MFEHNPEARLLFDIHPENPLLLYVCSWRCFYSEPQSVIVLDNDGDARLETVPAGAERRYNIWIDWENSTLYLEDGAYLAPHCEPYVPQWLVAHAHNHLTFFMHTAVSDLKLYSVY